jgi:hypothetical protein
MTLVHGMAAPGSTSTLRVQLHSSPGEVSTVMRFARFTSTLSDINNGLQLGMIESRRLADRLSDNIERASHEARKGENHEAREILRQFKDEVMK